MQTFHIFHFNYENEKEKKRENLNKYFIKNPFSADCLKRLPARLYILVGES